MQRWMRGHWFDKLWTSTFGLLDLAIDMSKDAALCASIDYCPEDAIDYHAESRLLERITDETPEALRVRVKDAWPFWSEVTSPEGLRDCLQSYAQCDELQIYDEANDGWVGNGVGSGFDDTNTDNASRHAIVVCQPHRWERPVVGPGLIVGPSLIVGISMTLSELSLIRRTYRRHRPANMVGIDLYVSFDATAPEDILADHEASGDYIRMPLHAAMVGYPNHGMVVGSSLAVGQRFT